jgi:hypothetical protein
MRKSTGVVLIGALFILVGVRLLGSPGSAGTTARTLTAIFRLAIGALSLAVAVALWRSSRHALALFITWAVAYLTGGALVRFLDEGAPLLDVVISWAITCAVLVAVGAYLRDALRQDHVVRRTSAYWYLALAGAVGLSWVLFVLPRTQ